MSEDEMVNIYVKAEKKRCLHLAKLEEAASGELTGWPQADIQTARANELVAEPMTRTTWATRRW